MRNKQDIAVLIFSSVDCYLLFILSLAFNKRTHRPSFSQLNGNVVYINRFVFQS